MRQAQTRRAWHHKGHRFDKSAKADAGHRAEVCAAARLRFTAWRGWWAYAGRMDRVLPTVFTVGHSTRSLGEFLGLLDESRIECVVDVRRVPGSRRFPQYDADALALSLGVNGIEYCYLPALCGRRTSRDLDGRPPENFWTNPSFARYAASALGDAFAGELHDLLSRADTQRCALMCSEAVWWRCHRRIISDHLLALGVRVLHITGAGNVDAASLTRGARIESAKVIYPAPDTD